MIRVVTPCRLHFGLFHVPAGGVTHWPDGVPVRRFGGVGMMVAGPRVAVRVEPANAWSATGPSGHRALGFARKAVAHRWPHERKPVRVTVEACPPEHVGLGVGTQLGLAVADAVNHLLGRASCTPADLAWQTGRGARSGIGVHGYRHGRLIVDAGKPADRDEVGRSAIVAAHRVPQRWRAVLARPRQPAVWHGDAEQRAFARPRDPVVAARTAEQLCRLALLGIVPAAMNADFPAFAAAVSEYNRLAGEAFADDQGGAYAGPQVAGLIETLRGWGVVGVGQSSWGPTVFALAEDEEAANGLASQLTREVPELDDVTVAEPDNRGSVVSRDGVGLYQDRE